MMQTATGLTSSGLRDWIVQRISAVVLGFYFIFLLMYFAMHPHVTYGAWQTLFAHPGMKIFSFLALLSLVGHSWVGIWTVLTDYVKCTAGRLLLEVTMGLALIYYLVWGIEILWK